MREVFNTRLTADYDIEESLDDETAQKIIQDCREFLSVVGSYLDGELNQKNSQET